MTAVAKSGLGALVCGAFLGFCGPSRLDGAWAHGLLLFSALVLVPLMLELFVESDETGAPAQWLAMVRRWQFPAALKLSALSAVLIPLLLLSYHILVRYTWVGRLLNGPRRRGGGPFPVIPPGPIATP